MKERWFNYRPLCLIFAFLLLGSVFAFFITDYFIASISVCILVFLTLLVLAIHKKKSQYVLVPCLAFLVGIFSYYLAVHSFNKSIDYSPSTIEARIYNVQAENNRLLVVEADSCIFDANRINTNILIYIYDYDSLFENIEIGAYIKFTPTKFYKSDLFFFKMPSSSLYINDLKYTVGVEIDDIEYIKTDLTLAEQIKDRVKDNLILSLTNENAEIAYSALFGDKDLLLDKQYNIYKLSGVAHLLAVSGLHVSIIAGILTLVLNFNKRRKWWKVGVVAIFLLFYMYLCGYTVSVLRASIMFMIFMISKVLGKEYDSFSSISLSGIIIFLINPLCMFDLAFLLSFSCAIGITMLYPSIHKELEKTKMPKAIVDSVAISLSVTIAIVVIMAYYFRTLNIISIIANVILIPLFTIAFSIIFIVSIFSFAIPVLSYIIFPVNYLLDLINLTATILGNLSISNFNTIHFNYLAIMIYFILLLFMGRFCTAKYQYKILATLPIVALLFICLL